MGIEITFVSNLKDVMDKIDETAKARMNQAVYSVQRHIQDEMTASKGGKTYTHYFWTDVQGKLRLGRERDKPHTASAEGAYPARDTSELLQHVFTEVEGEGKSIVGRVGTDIKYGAMLEFGTRKIAPRPWLRPTFEKKQKDIEVIVIRKWF